MLMVMVVHANSLANKMPTIPELNDLLSTITRVMVQTFANVNVDVFVLISGWFGIKFSAKGLLNILFQCLFYTLLCICLVVVLWPDSFSLSALVKSLYFGSCYWFVVAYLGLMILSPLLNKFVENSDRNQVRFFLLCYFTYQVIYGWLSLDEAHFIYGYSFVSFLGLYILARYTKIYRPRFSNFRGITDFTIYAVCSAIAGCFIIAALYTKSEGAVSIVRDKMLAYNSPLCILAALFLLLFFSKMKLKGNAIINGLAASCFAIYLIHCNALVLPQYLRLMRNLYQECQGMACLVVMLSTIILLSLLFILIDKIRILVYSLLCKKFFS